MIAVIENLLRKVKFYLKYGRCPTVKQFIEEWKKDPLRHFLGYYNHKLVWDTVYDWAPMVGLPNSHGLSMLPNIVCRYSEYKYSLIIGYIEEISMYSGGIVSIKHFALHPRLTRNNIGEFFLKSIIEFFKSKNAVVIEFQENHSTKIEHYRIFFKKLGVPEVRYRVWRVELYENKKIPMQVLAYQEKLKLK